MRVPDFERLIQDEEDMFSPEDENLRNLVGIVLYLCNHKETYIESGEIWDLCVNDQVYSDLVRTYALKYGVPPLVESGRKDIAWICRYDTRSMRDIASDLIGTIAKRSKNDFLRMT